MALADLFTRTKKKINDYFAPAPQVRKRDFVREAPQALKTTFNDIKTGGLAGLGKRISSTLETGEYFKPVPMQKPSVKNLGTGIRLRDFVRELPTGVGETGNKVMQDAARFAISAYEVPGTMKNKKATGKFYDTPLGRLNSYQSEAENRVKRGDPLWKAIGNPAAEAVLFGAPDVTALGKSVVKSPIVKSVGKRILGKTLNNEAKDIVADAGLKVARLARPHIFGKTGSPYRSKLMRSLSRPGGTIIAADPKNGFYPEGSYSSLFDKRAKREISDADAEVLMDLSDGKNFDGRLGGILKHDKLFEEYPWLRGIKTEVSQSGRAGKAGSYIPSENTIMLDAGDAKEVKRGLLHEVQHAIQEDNGFARGGSPDTFVDEALSAADRKTWPLQDELRKVSKLADREVRIFNRRMKAAEQKYGFSSDEYNAYKTKANKWLRSQPGYMRREELSAEIAKMKLDAEMPSFAEGMKKYKRLGGELESRAVERRMDLPQSELTKSDPYSAEAKATGIESVKDVIVRNNGGIVSGAYDSVDDFTPKMWAELNEIAGKAMRTPVDDARYADLESRFYKLPVDDQMQLLGMSDVIDDVPMGGLNEEIGNQYDTFTNLFKNPKLRRPEVKNAIMDGDFETLKRELSARGVMSATDVDNMLYDSEKSSDELLDMFKTQLRQDNPELFMGRKVANNLGAVKEDERTVDKAFVNEADRFMKEASEQSPFGGYLPSGAKDEPLMLPMGRDFTSKEAQRIFKKTGDVVPFKDVLKPAKPMVFGETGADFQRVKVGGSNPTERVRVDYNYADPEVPQNMSTIRKWITSGEKILNKSGVAGKELAKRMQQQRKSEDLLRGSYITDIKDTLGKLPEDERFMVTDILEGKEVPKASPRVQEAAQKMREFLDEVAEEAQVGGFEIRVPGGASVPFAKRPNYFPRQYDFDELQRGAMHDRVLQHLVESKQARNLAEAEKMLQEFVFANTERRSGNLENARMFDIPGYDRDPLTALQRYASGVAKRFTEAKYFGKKDEMAAALINKLAQNGGDYNEAQRIFDFQVEGMPKNDIVGAITKYNVATKLDLAFITNATQSLNTITKAGLINTIMGAGRGFTKKGRRLAEEVGAVQDSHIYEREVGKFNSVAKAIMIPFRIVENFNRRTAANTGLIRAKELFERAQKGSRFAIRELKSLGIDPATTKTLTEQDLKGAAYEMTRKTQFKVDSLDIPPAWKTPLGRLVTQFKSFSFAQTKFIRDEIVKEAAKGNIMPLLRFVPLAVGASLGSQYVRNILTGRDPQDDTKNMDIRQWDKWLKGFGSIPTDLIIQGKFLKDTYDSEYLTTMRKMSRVAGSTLGVTAGTIGSWLAAIESISSTETKNKQLGVEKEKQDPYLDLKRQAMGDVPIVGEYLKNTLLPYKKSTKTDEEKAQTKAYFDTKDRVMAGMTTKERAALDSLPTTNPLNPWAKIQKYTTYRTSPAVFEAKRQLALTAENGDMEKIDPLFRYEYQSVMPYLAYQSMLPNARERKALREKFPIIMQLGEERSKFFDANPIDPEFQQPNIPGLRPYPAVDAETEKLMDAKNWKHPKVQAYFDARDAWESQVYALAGVPLTDDGFGFGGGKGKKPPKPQYRELPFEDLEDFISKRNMDVSPKAQFGVGVPISKPSFSMPTRSQIATRKASLRKRKPITVSFRGRQAV
jgi:hypothetical protein